MMADLSPPSPPSPHHDDDDEQQDDPRPDRPETHRRSPPTPDASPSQRAAYAKERRLIELMGKAAQEIRVERNKVKQLMDENAGLRTEIKELRAKKSAVDRQLTNASLVKEVQDLRRQIADIMTIHKATVSELEQTKEQMRTLQSRYREQQRALQSQISPHVKGGRVAADSPTYADRHGGRSSSAGPRDPQPTHRGGRGAATVSASPSGRVSGASRHHSISPKRLGTAQQEQGRGGGRTNNSMNPVGFDAMESIRLVRESSPPRTTRSLSQQQQRVVMVTESSSSVSGKHHHADPNRDSAALVVPRQRMIDANPTAAEKQYNDLMLSRLRRAIAPPPSREQLAEVVHAMVGELVRSAARNGLKLDLKRVGPCQYDCGKRRLTLSVDSRRLVVKCGGGHVDMNEYAQRHHLWSAMEG